MKKEKILGLTHTEKMWLIQVKPTALAVKYLNAVLKQYDPSGYGLEFYDCDIENFSPKYKKWKNKSSMFFAGNECCYVFFMEDRIEILLRKDNEMFEKLKNEFLRYFEFVKPK